MEELKDIREEIDRIDDGIIDLFMRRMDCAEHVASYKAAHHMPVLDKSRERDLLAKVAERVPHEMRSYIEVLFQLLMEASRNRQDRRLGRQSATADGIERALGAAPELFPARAFVAFVDHVLSAPERLDFVLIGA